ncbi:T9SS type A sorting domain-containing protein [Psychroserpens sp.]|uniref:T9SS type A sorting domain-containing protein n=1 Tax=Psychroserpens sp. TaxID=2020870 RepID=UPI002B27774D|nr:T9SS type A sorting domain-containing protein [Psychroserpens sp.]
MKKVYLLKNTIITMVFLNLFLWSNAQVEPECGTIMSPEAQTYYQQLLPQIQQFENQFNELALQRASTAVSSVPIKAHIIRTDFGTGGLALNEFNSALAIMNSYFANAFIEFFLCESINYIDDSSLFDFETDEQNAMTTAHNIDNVINIYFANTVTSSSSGNGLCGYSYFPGGPEIILMNNSCTMNGSTLSHEMGHFFSLSHTHGNINGTLTSELVDGSNCDTAGDFICDTPADPQLSGSNVNTSCIYTGTVFDGNGQLFNPNPLNIMSYSRSACRTEFSPQQYARIYAVYQAARSVMECPNFNIDIASGYERFCGNNLEVSFTDNSVGATSWEWDVDGDGIVDYTSPNIVHTYSNQSNYDVTLNISNGSETITKVFQDYIDVGGNTINTSEVNLTLDIDDWPEEISWRFLDSDGNALYTNPTYVEGVDDFTTVTETFNVNLDSCYTFEMIDSAGDGICCFSGSGSFTLTTMEGVVIATGGDYGFGTKVFMENGVALSVDDFFLENSIAVYPNPSQTVLNIKLSNTNNLPDRYSIYNMLGQLVKTERISKVSDLAIDVSTFSDGMYFIELQKDSAKTTIQFVKN